MRMQRGCRHPSVRCVLPFATLLQGQQQNQQRGLVPNPCGLQQALGLATVWCFSWHSLQDAAWGVDSELAVETIVDYYWSPIVTTESVGMIGVR